MKNRIRFALILVACIWGVSSARAQVATSIVNTPHNLSVSGTGTIHATSEQEICIFCHTPHNAAPIQPLWNRSSPTSAYVPYSSTTLQSKPGQPTGSSKLCLSCHDGTIALGSVLSLNQTVQMANGVTTLPPGTTNLGTDLSGDHPISFNYDSALLALNPNLVDPSTLPKTLRLDHNKQLQCSTCHDAHDDSRGNFLTMDNSTSEMCTSCHVAQPSMVLGHNLCNDCHQTHNAPSGPDILRAATVTDTCNLCHGASNPITRALDSAQLATAAPTDVALAMAVPLTPGGVLAPIQNGPNVAADLTKLSRHNADVRINAYAPRKKPVDQVNCADCHEPHSMKKSATIAPVIKGNLGKVSGINAQGTSIKQARFEYEVCFKCHSEHSLDRAFVNRQIIQPNKRLQFDPTAISFHPVETRGRQVVVPSLTLNYTSASLIYCTDCHGSDNSKKTGGTGAAGPHGSNNRPLLLARYDTTDGTSESAAAYALCYSCHQRVSILANQSFPLHSSHIVNDRTPCSVCHDAHGIARVQGTTLGNSHLMNFDATIVRADPATKRMEYRQLGQGHGECYLLCHGKAHSPLKY